MSSRFKYAHLNMRNVRTCHQPCWVSLKDECAT